MRFRRLLVKLPTSTFQHILACHCSCRGAEAVNISDQFPSNLSHFTRMASKFFRSAASLRRFSPVITSETPGVLAGFRVQGLST